MSKNIVILGSTGSIGTQALKVCKANGYKVIAIAANSNVKLIEQQAREFNVEVAVLTDTAAADELKIKLADTNINVLSGVEGLCYAASMYSADIVLNSVVGIAGLRPTMAALNAGKTLALANKETLVAGGDIVMRTAKENGVKILPVDSEHSAIFQSLQGVPDGALNKIILTASGGPFYGKKVEDLVNITPEQALKHPNWSMGAKITIDSSTLMNKGLEVIEAVHLFGLSANNIEVLVHRQSIVHSAVELTDGAVIAQLATADMAIPIQYALTYPERSKCMFEKLSLSDVGTLTFAKPDLETFRCLDICIKAINEGGLKPAAANGANEEAVKLFLEGKIKYLQIPELIEKAVSLQPKVNSCTLDDVFDADINARNLVTNSVFGW